MARKVVQVDQLDDELLKLDNQLCFLLYASSRAITNLYRPLLKEMGLTYPQYLVMLVLWERKTASVGKLGELIYLNSGTLTPLLKRLEKAGFVVRTRSEQDERQVDVTLTVAGARLKRRASKVAMALICKLPLKLSKVTSLRVDLRALLQIAIQAEAETELSSKSA